MNAIPISESISPSQARATVHTFSFKRDSPSVDRAMKGSEWQAVKKVRKEAVEHDGLIIAAVKAERERLTWVDVARGLSIVLVVHFHSVMWLGFEDLALPAYVTINETLAFVRIPLFFAVSGLLSAGLFQRGVRSVFERRVLPLLALYVVWNLIEFTLLVAPRSTFSIENFLMHMSRALVAPEASVLWFLWALSIFTAVGTILHQLPVLIAWIFTVVCAFVLPMLLPSIADSKQYFVIAYAPIFFGAAYFGRAIMERGKKEIVIFMSFAALILTITLQIPVQSLELYYPMYLIQNICGVLLGVGLAILLCQLKAVSTYIGRLGRNTLPIYVFHTLLQVLLVSALASSSPHMPLFLYWNPFMVTGLSIIGSLLLQRLGRISHVAFLFEIPPWQRSFELLANKVGLRRRSDQQF